MGVTAWGSEGPQSAGNGDFRPEIRQDVRVVPWDVPLASICATLRWLLLFRIRSRMLWGRSGGLWWRHDSEPERAPTPQSKSCAKPPVRLTVRLCAALTSETTPASRLHSFGELRMPAPTPDATSIHPTSCSLAARDSHNTTTTTTT